MKKAREQKNTVLRFTQLALQVAQAVLPAQGHKFTPKSRSYAQPQLLACLLLKEFLRQDYRSTVELLELSDGLRSALRLPQVPDHTTLWWFAQHKVTPELLQAALEQTVRLLETQQNSTPPPAQGQSSTPTQGQVALDSNGLFTSHASRYFEWRKSETQPGRTQRSWLKWSGALWTGPQLLLSQQVRPGPCGDFAELVPLAQAAHAVRKLTQVLADGGFDSEANHRFCRESLGCDSLIPAHARRGVHAKTPYRQEMQQRLGIPGLSCSLDENSRRAYGQRWKAETLMSVLKRKWGETLSARREAAQRLQALLRGVVYNLYRLVQLNL